MIEPPGTPAACPEAFAVEQTVRLSIEAFSNTFVIALLLSFLPSTTTATSVKGLSFVL
jgi:hypothetical protein